MTSQIDSVEIGRCNKRRFQPNNQTMKNKLAFAFAILISACLLTACGGDDKPKDDKKPKKEKTDE